MRHYKKRFLRFTACLLLFGFLFTGCGGQEKVVIPVTSHTLEVTEEGRLIAYLVEDFDKEYYDIKELAEMVRTEIDAYNVQKASLSAQAGQEPIRVEQVMMAEDGSAKAVVVLEFQNPAVYEDYMGRELFFGTVSEAIAAGYGLEDTLFDVKKGELLSAGKIEKNGRRSILILEDGVSVRPGKKVLYLSSNAVLTAEGYVDAQGEGLKYIVTK